LGGGKIKSKLLLSVLLLFGLAIILNVSTASACNVTSVNSTPKVTAIDPVNKAIVLNTKVIKIKFNTPIKNGNKFIQLKSTSNGKINPTKTSISGETLSIIPTTTLTKGSSYQILMHSGSVEDLSGNGVHIFSTSFMISPITLAQMKDGLKKSTEFLQYQWQTSELCKLRNFKDSNCRISGNNRISGHENKWIYRC
jgi:methionine-rich copper-binding protein CopC